MVIIIVFFLWLKPFYDTEIVHRSVMGTSREQVSCVVQYCDRHARKPTWSRTEKVDWERAQHHDIARYTAGSVLPIIHLDPISNFSFGR